MTDVLQMERTSSQELTDPNPPALQPATELRLFVALSPLQFAMLTDRRPILPDPYSLRFGLRTDPLKHSNVPITLCHGQHHTQSLLLATPSRSTCCAPSPSRRKECSHFSLPTYWRRATAQTLTGLDTSGSVVHFSMVFVDQMSSRRSTTCSKTNTPSWFCRRTRCQITIVWSIYTCGEVILASLWNQDEALVDIVKSQDIRFCGIPRLRPVLGGVSNQFTLHQTPMWESDMHISTVYRQNKSQGLYGKHEGIELSLEISHVRFCPFLMLVFS